MMQNTNILVVTYLLNVIKYIIPLLVFVGVGNVNDSDNYINFDELNE